MTFEIITLGCKVNQHESQQMADMLIRCGYTPADGNAHPDICIINSCTVTSTADAKTRQMVHRSRREHPNAVICLTGCMPQAFPEQSEAVAEADIIIGNSNRELLPSLIIDFIDKHQRVVRVEKHPADYSGQGCVTRLGDRARAYIKIEDGCNRFCSYCIIPYARGRVRSRPLIDIAAEAQAISQNCREVVLVGINLSSYGQDNGLTLADAVDAAAAPEGIERVRLGSMEPDMLTDELLDRLAAQPKLCPQFHIALQSGCDATLKRMNRHYTSGEFAELCDKLRARFDNPSITTDIMVGFAGESDEEFEQSLAFAKRIGFARTHCFVYSRREGTAAYNMPCQVSPPTAAGRSARLIAQANEDELAFMHSQIGKRVRVLIEREASDGIWEGYSENYTDVRVFEPCERGSIVLCEIYGVEDGACSAAVIGKV